MTDWIELAYRAVTGELMLTRAMVGAPWPAPAPLRGHQIILEDGTELLYLSTGDGDPALGYARLDNEILAGLRLHWLTQRRPELALPYPAQVSRLYGYEPDSAEPFVLLHPFRGEPVAEVGRRLLPEHQDQFRISLLQGLRWLAAAGLAHRNLTPGTVRWDRESQQVQITDFSEATVFGVPRTVAGTGLWAGPEQRPRGTAGQVTGEVGERDDIWGAGQLLCYLLTGEELTGPQQLAGLADPGGALRDIFTRADSRPSAQELLRRLHEPDPVPRALTSDPLAGGRARFAAVHPEPGAPPAETAAPGTRAGPSGAPPAGPARSRSRVVAMGGLLIVLVVLGVVVGLLR
jgi:serine/threonine protein kinase